MLIKGCKKNLIVVRSLGSDYIDEAYLILKPELPAGVGGQDIVKEANRIIHEYDTGKHGRRRPFSLPSFLLGVCLTGALAALTFLLFLL